MRYNWTQHSDFDNTGEATVLGLRPELWISTRVSNRRCVLRFNGELTLERIKPLLRLGRSQRMETFLGNYLRIHPEK